MHCSKSRGVKLSLRQIRIAPYQMEGEWIVPCADTLLQMLGQDVVMEKKGGGGTHN